MAFMQVAGCLPASLVEGRRVGPGRVVEDFFFVVIPLPGDNAGVVPVFDGCGGHAELPGHLAEGIRPASASRWRRLRSW